MYTKSSFVETHVLVRLVYDEATAIILVARISAVTTGEKNGGKTSESTVVSKTRLQVRTFFMMNKLTPQE